MSKIIAFLSGKKSYIIALVGAVVVFLNQIGYLDPDLTNQVILYLFPAGLITLRQAVSKV